MAKEKNKKKVSGLERIGTPPQHTHTHTLPPARHYHKNVKCVSEGISPPHILMVIYTIQYAGSGRRVGAMGRLTIKKWEERNTAEYTATKYYLLHTKNICKPAEKTLKGNLKYNYSWKI